MRIIGNIEHPNLKITVFKMDNKLSIKFETGLYEQTFKFRESEELNDFASMEKLVDEEFVRFVTEQFEKMHRAKNAALGRYMPSPETEVFEEII